MNNNIEWILNGEKDKNRNVLYMFKYKDYFCNVNFEYISKDSMGREKARLITSVIKPIVNSAEDIYLETLFEDSEYITVDEIGTEKSYVDRMVEVLTMFINLHFKFDK